MIVPYSVPLYIYSADTFTLSIRTGFIVSIILYGRNRLEMLKYVTGQNKTERNTGVAWKEMAGKV